MQSEPIDTQYSNGFRDGAKAEREKIKSLMRRIAELDGLVECTSSANWRDKVKKMAVNYLKGG